MLRYITAGESHGKTLTVIMEGVPSGLKISSDYINIQLKRRQQGYGRGMRMDIEHDKVSIHSGIRFSETTGAPICMQVLNKDWENNREIMAVEGKNEKEISPQTKPRPGHADLAGVIKYNLKDIRDILERASARETAARVAAGAVARKFLQEFDIKIASFTSRIGRERAENIPGDIERIVEVSEKSPLRCTDRKAEKKMIEEIEKAGSEGDTIGGVFTVVAEGVPPGLGSHIQWDRKLDAVIARALMSIQAVKGVETGMGFEMACRRGSQVHDEIEYDSKKKRFYRITNNAGGFEGGITNGERLVFNSVMKPISSLKKPLRAVDIYTKKDVFSEIVRSDVCAVPAAGVVGEAVVAVEVASALLDKTGGDSMCEVKRNFENYLKQVSCF